MRACPTMREMSVESGYPAQPDNTLADDLIDNLVIWGDDATIAANLDQLRASGLNELLLYSVPVGDADDEMKRLMELIGRL